jgi:hypothetical protein
MTLNNTSYPPPNVQPQPAAPVYAPSPIYSQGVPAGTYQPSPLTVQQASNAIIHHESGSTPTNLKNPTSPSGAVGPGQIMPATAKPYMRPGEDLHNPTDNYAIHQRIMDDYARRWPNDPARWAVAYFSGPGNVSPPGSPHPWIRNTGDGNNTVEQYVANTVGKAGAGGGGTPTATAAAAPAAQPLTVGGALGALTLPNAAGSSPLGDANQGPQQQQAQQYAAQNMLQQQQAAAPGGFARQAAIAAQAAQLAALTRQGAAQPLTWGTRPFGSTAGQQMPPPGTTLNTTGAA